MNDAPSQSVETPKPLNKTEQAKLAKDGFETLADLFRYSEQGDYDAIEKDDLEVRFKWYGVYRQKPNTGHFMLRIKIPGGQLTTQELTTIARIGEKYGRGFGDITTRQDIQFHWLTIEDIKPVFEMLRDAGMTTQFACGDTPRNVVGCPLSGVNEGEIIDATQAVRDASALYLEGGREFSNLPRKFKAAIGGCNLHCHQPQINDYGLFGVKRADGSVGYGLVVGGGLSDTPHFAKPMQVFIRPEQVKDVARAVAVLFRDHGYREKRGRARLKFLVADKGWHWTLEMLEQILGYKLEHDASIHHPPAVGSDHMGVGRQKDGNFYVGVPIGRGRLTTRNMADLARLAEQFAVGPRRVRLTNRQNVLLLDVPEANVAGLTRALDDAGLHPAAHSLRSSLISCTGSEFCNLAVVETKHRAGRVLKYLEEHVDVDFPLSISFTGCPNACAQFQVCDIGLTGTMLIDKTRKDEHDKPLKVEGYNVTLGAAMGGDPKFGEMIAKKVPAEMVHLSIQNLVNEFKANRVDEDETFFQWVSRNEPEHLQNLIVAPTVAAGAVGLGA